MNFDDNTRKTLVSELLCLADSKWALGHWYIKVMLNSRTLTDATAFAGMSQDELGHTRALFRWMEDELRWFADHERPTLRELRSGDLATVTQALQRLSQRRLFRDRLATAVLGLLEERNPVLRRMGCKALGSLGEPLAVPRLTEALGDRDDEVAAAAQAALERITQRS